MLPATLGVEAVAKWLDRIPLTESDDFVSMALAVRALVEKAVREALECADQKEDDESFRYSTHDAIVSRILGTP